MSSSLSSSIKHSLDAFLAELSDDEMQDACLSFAQHAHAKAPDDWERCLQALKRSLRNTPFWVSNVNKLKEKSPEDLSQLIRRVINNKNFYEHTRKILKIWLLTRKFKTLATFLDATGLRHTDGMIIDDQSAAGRQDFLAGIHALQENGHARDNALYLNFILDIWADTDNFWGELRPAVEESGININLNELAQDSADISTSAKAEDQPKITNNKRAAKMTKEIYYQRILFGSPGTGKSHRIVHELLPLLGIENESENVIKTVFHPEYTYGDFMGKLLPITNAGKVEYRYYAGHFAQALAQAYKNLLDINDCDAPNKVALIIDEINRGNSSAIFGTTFQLLDREDDGWSSYSITLSELEFVELLKLIGLKTRMGIKTSADSDYIEFDPLDKNHTTDANLPKVVQYSLRGGNWVQDYASRNNQSLVKNCRIDLATRCVRIPSNLSIIGSMNTSDNSIYFMDSAFKRRWGWEFVDWDDESKIPEAKYASELNETGWKHLVRNLNYFLKSKHEYIRGIEDKQIGFYFIKEWMDGGSVSEESVRNKLMFFVWDSVFQRDKKPLLELINRERDDDSQLRKSDLVTFGDFCQHHNGFVNALLGNPDNY